MFSPVCAAGCWLCFTKMCFFAHFPLSAPTLLNSFISTFQLVSVEVPILKNNDFVLNIDTRERKHPRRKKQT